MLTHLHIRDFAIIDAVEVDFARGLTVLTGETGAGKSILVDALQLAVGGRGGVEVIRHGAARAEITATFDLAAATSALRQLLEEQSIEADDELVVRRVITREGKSRAYLNGQQVPLQLLREAGESLAEIHGQHEFQTLVRGAAQRDLLDAFGRHHDLAAEVARRHRERLARSTELDALSAAARDRDARLDLLRHQCGELSALALRPGEVGVLAEERGRLANSGRLAEAARGAVELLYEAEGSNAHAIASRAVSVLRQAAALDPRLQETLPALEEAVIRLADVARDLTRYLDSLEADPGRQEELEQRLASIESLARKHRVATDELPAKADELAADLARLERVEDDLTSLRAAAQAAVTAWRESAERLSAARKKAAAELAAEVSARMQTLGMTGGRFAVELTPLAGIDGGTAAQGLEDIGFLVSANTGQPPRPLGKVASGGELSRLSLAVQVALAGRLRGGGGGCMVFDEVDSGVGGAVAEIVGRELALLGASAQVLCVTHLPQVAALGNRHLRVAKLTDGQTTRTQVVPLEATARVEEIARMLGGVSITDKAREHAAEMLADGSRVSRRSPPRGAGSSPSGNARKSRERGR
ncbi:MAG: DNA repair protein RecN [Gammaproteobacteria bacterium]|nr:DNA repair protein RecN [Gammaproteobacteria bacterium]